MLSLYKATSLPLEAVSSSVHEFHIPDGSLLGATKSLIPSRSSFQTRSNHERSFADENLATQGTVFVRRALTPLRTFLWRILSSDRVLEIKAVGLIKSRDDQREASKTLRFRFSSPILPCGVAFADHETEPDSNSIFAFIITEDRFFHTLRIDAQNFCHITISQEKAAVWSQTYHPSSFSLHLPCRIYAQSIFEVYVALANGSVVRLRRPKDWKVSRWDQDIYDYHSWVPSFWSSKKSLKYDGINYSVTTALAIEASSDQQLLFTLCLDQTLRIWNLASGKLEIAHCLTNTGSKLPDAPIMTINPSGLSFVRSSFLSPGHYSLVTFIPNEDGQFKFWNVRGAPPNSLTVEDRFPDKSLRPPDPDPSGNSVWSVTGVEIKMDENRRPAEIWVLWRSNDLVKMYTCQLDVADSSQAWEQNWVETDFLMPYDDQPPDLGPSTLVNTAEVWLRYILEPGRFNKIVLKTALSIYQEALNLGDHRFDPKSSLAEKISVTIANTLTLSKTEDLELAYDRFHVESDSQWRQFWRIARNLQERMRAPLSISFDANHGVPWVTTTGHCYAIREHSNLEFVRHNDAQLLRSLGPIAIGQRRSRVLNLRSEDAATKIALLIEAAAKLRQSCRPDYQSRCRLALLTATTLSPGKPTAARLSEYIEVAKMQDELTDEASDAVLAALDSVGGSMKAINDSFTTVLELLPQNIQKKSELRYTWAGLAVVSAGAREVIGLARQLLFDLCNLVIFIVNEVDQDGKDFSPPSVFSELTTLLSQYERRYWLCTHPRDRSVAAVKDSASASTVLEDLFGVHMYPWPPVQSPESSLLTEGIDELVTEAAGAPDVDPDDAVVFVLFSLISSGDLDLASDYLRFLPSTAWSSYGKGRLFLARHSFDEAAFQFKRAAQSLACGKALGNLHDMSARLLSLVEVSNFFDGLPKYYQHIIALFESEKAYSYVADFASLGLQVLKSPHQRQDLNTRTELLSRLFTAELQCCNYRAAYRALSEISDIALKKKDMTTLVQSIVSTCGRNPGGAQAIHVLQTLPLGLQPILAEVVDETLTALADKQVFLPDLGDSKWPSAGTVDYLRILLAYRFEQGDLRGAVSVLLQRLNLVKKSSRARNDPEAVELRRCFLFLINTLASVPVDDAYVITEVFDESDQVGSANSKTTDSQRVPKKRRRIVVTLDDLRREYQMLLDKCSRIERGDYEFYDGGGEEDEDESEVVNGQVNGYTVSGEAMDLLE